MKFNCKNNNELLHLSFAVAKLYKDNLLPNKILLTGQSGLGKSTFAYHFINYLLSIDEDYSYSISDYKINQHEIFDKMAKHSMSVYREKIFSD